MARVDRGKRFELTEAAPVEQRPQIWVDGRQQPRFKVGPYVSVSLAIAKRDLVPDMIATEARLRDFGARVRQGEVKANLAWAGRFARAMPQHQTVAGWIMTAADIYAGARIRLEGNQTQTEGLGEDGQIAYPDLIKRQPKPRKVRMRQATNMPAAAPLKGDDAAPVPVAEAPAPVPQEPDSSAGVSAAPSVPLFPEPDFLAQAFAEAFQMMPAAPSPDQLLGATPAKESETTAEEPQVEGPTSQALAADSTPSSPKAAKRSRKAARIVLDDEILAFDMVLRPLAANPDIIEDEIPAPETTAPEASAPETKVALTGFEEEDEALFAPLSPVDEAALPAEPPVVPVEAAADAPGGAATHLAGDTSPPDEPEALEYPAGPFGGPDEGSTAILFTLPEVPTEAFDEALPLSPAPETARPADPFASHSQDWATLFAAIDLTPQALTAPKVPPQERAIDRFAMQDDIGGNAHPAISVPALDADAPAQAEPAALMAEFAPYPAPNRAFDPDSVPFEGLEEQALAGLAAATSTAFWFEDIRQEQPAQPEQPPYLPLSDLPVSDLPIWDTHSWDIAAQVLTAPISEATEASMPALTQDGNDLPEVGPQMSLGTPAEAAPAEDLTEPFARVADAPEDATAEVQMDPAATLDIPSPEDAIRGLFAETTVQEDEAPLPEPADGSVVTEQMTEPSAMDGAAPPVDPDLSAIRFAIGDLIEPAQPAPEVQTVVVASKIKPAKSRRKLDPGAEEEDEALAKEKTALARMLSGFEDLHDPDAEAEAAQWGTARQVVPVRTKNALALRRPSAIVRLSGSITRGTGHALRATGLGIGRGVGRVARGAGHGTVVLARATGRGALATLRGTAAVASPILRPALAWTGRTAHVSASWALLLALMAFATPGGAVKAMIYYLDGGDLSDWS